MNGQVESSVTEWITTAEAAELTGYNLEYIRQMIRRGISPPTAEALKAWLKVRPQNKDPWLFTGFGPKAQGRLSKRGGENGKCWYNGPCKKFHRWGVAKW